jgi:chaperone required for assembly of F1-ATPase
MNETKRVARKLKTVDASIALAMLQSAMSYCQSAKMPVVLEQQNTTLVINLSGVRAVIATTGKVKFELITTLVKDVA